MLQKEKLEKLYKAGYSAKEIADKLGYSESGIRYLMRKYSIPRRSMSEAIYVKNNPNGDPFLIKSYLTSAEEKLFGLGLGLYWGEGTKANKNAVKLSNSDPGLIKAFRNFLIRICQVRQEKIYYRLLLFNNANKEKAIGFWARELEIPVNKIASITKLKPRGKGSYKKKSQTGVLTIEFGNTKLKKQIDQMIEGLR